MNYNTMISSIENTDRMAYRKEWEEFNKKTLNIFVTQVKNVTAKRGAFGVNVKPFFAKSNPHDYALEVYFPTKEDLNAIDWCIY